MTPVPVPLCADDCKEGQRCDAATRSCVLAVEARCVAPSSWTAGVTAFSDASAQWGLSGNFAGGTRLSSADFDGDGRQDLIVRRAGNHRDDGSDGGTRAVWLLRNTGSAFEDVTHTSGILNNRTEATALGRPAEVVVFADVDNDGDLDAYTGASATATETSELLLNDGQGTFALGPAGSDLRRTNDAVAGASFVDVNRDGLIDLWVGGAGRNGGGTQDQLYIGDGTGAFFDITGSAGLATVAWSSVADLNDARAHSYAWGTTACDLNADGLPELLASSYGRSPNHLWQAQPFTSGFPTYVSRSIASGFASDHRVDWSDNESARCHCKLHPSDPDCAGVPAPEHLPCQTDADAFRWNHTYDRNPFRLGGNTGSSACGDVDADGDLDLLNLEIVHWDVGSSSDPSELLYNTGEPDVRFERPGNAVTGLTKPRTTTRWDDGDITGALFDFDNDGRQDVLIASTDYAGTRAYLYHQTPDGTFEAVPLSDGIDHTSAHGIAVADFDRDGDLDVVMGHSRNRCSTGTHCYPEAHARFFSNEIGHKGNWVQLDLRGGEGTNRAAIGARVEVKTARGTQAFEVGGGHGHYGMQHDLVVHAGLGEACEAEVTIHWPDAKRTKQTFKAPANWRLVVPQGQPPHPAAVP